MMPDIEHFPPAQTHLLTAQHVDQVFKIEVMQPPFRAAPHRPLPVVYTTDGNSLFALFKEICVLLQRSGHGWPPFILVGIGYPGEAPNSGGILRVRDYTFPGCPECLGDLGLMPGIPATREGSKTFCGAEDFQKFLEQDLIPFIEQTYDTDPAERTYFGHSLGGAFGLYNLLTKPGMFAHYIVSSPAAAYDGETPAGTVYHNHEFLIDLIGRFLDEQVILPSTTLRISVGSDEDQDALLANWRFTSSFHRLVDFLETHPIRGLRVTSELIVGKNHISVLPSAFMNGIGSVVPPAMKPSS